MTTANKKLPRFGSMKGKMRMAEDWDAPLEDFMCDPFDCMLVAQAMAEDMAIMTTDTEILKYDIAPIW